MVGKCYHKNACNVRLSITKSLTDHPSHMPCVFTRKLLKLAMLATLAMHRLGRET